MKKKTGEIRRALRGGRAERRFIALFFAVYAALALIGTLGSILR